MGNFGSFLGNFGYFGSYLCHFGSFLGHFVAFLEKIAEFKFFGGIVGVQILAFRMYAFWFLIVFQKTLWIYQYACQVKMEILYIYIFSERDLTLPCEQVYYRGVWKWMGSALVAPRISTLGTRLKKRMLRNTGQEAIILSTMGISWVQGKGGGRKTGKKRLIFDFGL